METFDIADEIERLHAFFVDWYTAEIPESGFETCERALAPSFQRVAPDGSVGDRETVLETIREQYGRYEPGAFSIRIENVERIEAIDEWTLVRYDEHQRGPKGENVRRSTGLFGSGEDGTDRPKWHYLQETWVEPP